MTASVLSRKSVLISPSTYCLGSVGTPAIRWSGCFLSCFERCAMDARWRLDTSGSQGKQSTAIANAEQTWCMRSSLRRPSRSVSAPTETLSMESRLTADRRGIGSSPVSSTTSLGSPRIFVVQGAINARRSRGIAASRERTTTGRREISGSWHHQTSPLDGRSFTTKR